MLVRATSSGQFFFFINIGRLSSHMASLRPGTRRDGSTYVQVLYRLDGKQSSTSFEDLASAKKFQKLVDKYVNVHRGDGMHNQASMRRQRLWHE
jgi:hypothetical protein